MGGTATLTAAEAWRCCMDFGVIGAVLGALVNSAQRSLGVRDEAIITRSMNPIVFRALRAVEKGEPISLWRAEKMVNERDTRGLRLESPRR